MLVQYYAPWCPYCKKLDPIYAELANDYKDSDEVGQHKEACSTQMCLKIFEVLKQAIMICR